MDPTLRIALDILLAVVIIAGSFYVTSRIKRKNAGRDPQAIKQAVAVMGEEYRMFSDVLVPSPYGMSRLDHVIVSPYGIFVVTVIRIPGKVTGRESEREWHVKNQGKWDTLKNPQWENRKRKNELEAYLGVYPYLPVVAFSQASLKGQFAKNVMAAHRLFDFIKKHDRVVLTAEQLEAIIAKLEKPVKGESREE